jgi:alpha-L-rhamnosidase
MKQARVFAVPPFLPWALLTLGFLFSHPLAQAQQEDLSQVWPAKWIAATNGPWSAYGVHRFRKTFALDSVPRQLIVHSSGDNRYQLFVNGKMVSWGPLRGDLDHWYYESTDIAPYLQPGKNVIAAQVLNYGSHPPDAQMSIQTAFVLAAGERPYRFLNTNASWQATYDPSYSPNIIDGTQVRGYYGGGSREIVDGRKYLWNWEQTDFADTDWPAAVVIESAFAKTCIWASRWKLTPRSLPHENISAQRFAAIRLAEGVEPQADFIQGNRPFRVPAHTQARIIFDQGWETTAYPELRVSGGREARITIRYVEAPVIGEGRSRKKGNRNEIAGKTFFGYYDQFIADGGAGTHLSSPLVAGLPLHRTQH